MSITRFLLRQITMKAITGRTMAEDRVRDSSIQNLEAALADAPKPIALVYTDDSDFVPIGRELTGGQGTQHLVILISNSGFVKLKKENPEEGEEEEEGAFVFPVTDETLEMSLDIMESQIQRALNDPQNPWADLWMKIVCKVEKWSSNRGQSDKKGTRFAARQIIMQLETLHDPIPGGELEGVWPETIAAIKADPDPDFAGLGAIVEDYLAGKPIAQIRRNGFDLGMPYSSLKGIGLGAIVPTDDGGSLPEEMTEIDITDEGKIE